MINLKEEKRNLYILELMPWKDLTKNQISPTSQKILIKTIYIDLLIQK